MNPATPAAGPEPPDYNDAVRTLQIGAVEIGGGRPLVLIGGPCVIESPAHAVDLGGAIAEVAEWCWRFLR